MDYGNMTLDEYLDQKKKEFLYHEESESFRKKFSEYDESIKQCIREKFKNHYDPNQYVFSIPALEDAKLLNKKILLCAEILKYALDMADKVMEIIMEGMEDGEGKGKGNGSGDGSESGEGTGTESGQ